MLPDRQKKIQLNCVNPPPWIYQTQHRHGRIWQSKLSVSNVVVINKIATTSAITSSHTTLGSMTSIEPDLFFIHCHIFMQKLLFVALKQLQTILWIINVLLFLIDCKQTYHPLWTQLSHSQMFMQNGEYTAFWYLYLLCYLTQLQFTISQNEFMEVFGVFQDNCQIWVTWIFSIICVCMTAFKVSLPPLNCRFQWSRVQITLIKPLLCLNNIFSLLENNYLSTHEIQIFSFFWKFAIVKSKVGDHSWGQPESSIFNSYYTKV